MNHLWLFLFLRNHSIIKQYRVFYYIWMEGEIMIRVAIVGTNFISDQFMKSISTMDGFEVIGVCSKTQQHAKEFYTKYNLKKCYKSFDEMLEDQEVDAVYLAVPNSLHQPFAMDCISYRKHVFVEKPMATSKRNAKVMFQYANSMNVVLHDGLVPMYTNNFAILKQSLPMVGKIRRCIFSFEKYSSRYDAYLEGKNPTTFQKELCNGCWMDLGVYCLGVCVGLFDQPNTIQASANLLESQVDGNCCAILKYDGFDVNILASKINDGCNVSTIEGEEGTIFIKQLSLMKEIVFVDRKTKEEKILSIESKDPFQEQILDFYDCIVNQRQTSPLFDKNTSLKVMEVLEECRKKSGVLYKGERL